MPLRSTLLGNDDKRLEREAQSLMSRVKNSFLLIEVMLRLGPYRHVEGKCLKVSLLHHAEVVETSSR